MVLTVSNHKRPAKKLRKPDGRAGMSASAYANIQNKKTSVKTEVFVDRIPRLLSGSADIVADGIFNDVVVFAVGSDTAFQHGGGTARHLPPVSYTHLTLPTILRV